MTGTDGAPAAHWAARPRRCHPEARASVKSLARSGDVLAAWWHETNRLPPQRLRRQRHWLVVERLPAYAPDLNPVEALWANLKGVELANLAGDTLAEVTAAAERGVQRLRGTPHLAYSFLRYCGLSLW